MKLSLFFILIFFKFYSYSQNVNKFQLGIGGALSSSFLEDSYGSNFLQNNPLYINVGYRINKNIEFNIESGIGNQKNIVSYNDQNSIELTPWKRINAIEISNRVVYGNLSGVYHLFPYNRFHLICDIGLGVRMTRFFNKIVEESYSYETSEILKLRLSPSGNPELFNELQSIAPNSRSLNASIGIGIDVKLTNRIVLRFISSYNKGFADFQQIRLHRVYFDPSYNEVYGLVYSKTPFEVFNFSGSLIYKIY